MLEFQSSAELIAHYKAVRARLNRAATVVAAPRPVDPSPIVHGLATPARTDPSSSRFHGHLVLTIISLTARRFGVSSQDILSPGRTGAIIQSRHVAMYIAHSQSQFSLPQIGRVFKRDHTSVLYAVRKIDGLLSRDEGLAGTIRAISAELAGQGGTSNAA